MGTGEVIGEILGRWISALEKAHVLLGPADATAAALGRWLTFLSAATEGDEATARELYKLAAFHARGLGAEGKPASAALMQVLLLEDVLRANNAFPQGTFKVTRELTRIVADAHALGATERAKNKHLLEIRDFSPVIRLGENTIVGFLLGPMERDLIDAMIGRLLRETARSGAQHVVLDCFGAARDTDVFHRTLQAFLKHEVGIRVNITLSGLRDPDATKAALLALGCVLERVTFETDANSAVAASLTR